MEQDFGGKLQRTDDKQRGFKPREGNDGTCRKDVQVRGEAREAQVAQEHDQDGRCHTMVFGHAGHWTGEELLRRGF